MPSLILTQPVSTGTDLLTPISANVPWGTITQVDLAAYRSIKWFYTLTDPTDQRTISGEVRAHIDSTGQATWTVYGIIGNVETMKHTITVSVNAGSLELLITNNDTNNNDWVSDVIRMGIS